MRQCAFILTQPGPWGLPLGMNLIQTIGANVKALRLAKSPRWSRAYLESISGVHRSTIAAIENGRRASVQLSTVEAIADALGVCVADLASATSALALVPDPVAIDTDAGPVDVRIACLAAVPPDWLTDEATDGQRRAIDHVREWLASRAAVTLDGGE